MPKAARFALIFAAAALLVLAIAGMLAWSVDPIGYFGRRTANLHFSLSRETKAGLLRNPHPENRQILFGTSLMLGFDPASLPQYPLMNLAMSGQEPDEVAHMVELLVRDQKLVVIGIDVQTGLRRDPTFTPGPFAALSPANLAKFLWSHQIVYQSAATLTKDLLGVRPRMNSMGYSSQPYIWAENPYGERYQRYIDIVIGIVRGSAIEGKLPAYRRIRDTLAERNIPVVTFLQPLNEDVLAALEREGLTGQLDQWRAAMKSVFPDLLDLTRSEFSARDRYPFDEAVHFDPATATAVVQAALEHFGAVQSKSSPSMGGN